ncbi:hypothetical protein PENSPDRAFT_681657 [Peniophora sp. CONT]|nr:hypothetical protein PENSPDRAFT_681657 [Peniophora sp. CONT]
MKVTASLTALALALSASAAPNAPVERAAADYDRCTAGRDSANYLRDNLHPWIQQLFEPCIGPTNQANIWSSRTCVAAAIAMGPAVLTDFATCDKHDTLSETEQPNLDYGVYASIVGDCAYDKTACKMTAQNMLDLIYSELSKAGATIWPSDASEVVADVIGPVLDWSFGSYTDPVGYTRFNEFLHISPYQGTITDDSGHSDGKTYFYDHEDDRE